MANSSRYVITIDANGTPASQEIGKLRDSVDRVDDALDDVNSPTKLDNLKGSFSAVGGQLSGLIGPLGLAGVATGIFKIADQAAQLAIDAGITASALNTSVEEASLLNAALGDVGIEANDVVALALQVGEQLSTNEELAARFGLKVGEQLEPIDALRLAIDSWDLLTPTERVQIFGEEGVLQIARITGEGQKLDDILAGIDTDRILTAEQVERAEAYKDSMAEIRASYEEIIIALGDSIIPQLTQVVGLMADAVNFANGLKVEINGVDLGFLSGWVDLWDAFIENNKEILREFGILTPELESTFQGVEVSASRTTTQLELAEAKARGLGRALGEIPTDITTTIRLKQSGVYAPPTYPGAQTNNITVNLARTASVRDVDAAIARWASVNG
jgi:hypothetical protein